jgi:hypothetical protein
MLHITTLTINNVLLPPGPLDAHPAEEIDPRHRIAKVDLIFLIQ